MRRDKDFELLPRLGSAYCRHCDTKIPGTSRDRTYHIWKEHPETVPENMEHAWKNLPFFLKLFTTKKEVEKQFIQDMQEYEREVETLK